MIEDAVIQRTLDAALRTGGEFAEVFVEDKRSRRRRCSTTARSRSSTAAATAAPGIRVVVGETTGFAHTADLSETGLRSAPPTRQRRRPGAVAGVPRPSPCDVEDRPRPNEVTIPPEDVAKAHQGRAARPRPTRRPERRATSITQVIGPLRRQPAPHPRRQQRRPARRRRSGPHAVLGVVRRHRRHRHADRPRDRSAAPIGFELFDEVDVRGPGPHAPPTGPSPSSRPARRPVGAMPVVDRQGRRRCAVPRGLRSRPRGRPRGQERLGLRRSRGRAGRQPSWSPSSTTAPWPASGAAFAIDDEGTPGPAQRADRGRRAHRLHVGLPAGPQGRSRRARATVAARATSTCRWSA